MAWAEGWAPVIVGSSMIAAGTWYVRTSNRWRRQDSDDRKVFGLDLGALVHRG